MRQPAFIIGRPRTGLPPKIANDNLLQHSGPVPQFLTNKVAVDSLFPSIRVHAAEIRPYLSDCRHFGTHGHPVESANKSLAELAGFLPTCMDEEHYLYFDDEIVDDLEDNNDQVFDEFLFDMNRARYLGCRFATPGSF